MQQQLENLAYDVPRTPERKQVVYQVGDLESLSASALYYGAKGSPLGSPGAFGIVKTPLMKTENSKIDFQNLPIYSGPSKIFIPEVKTPLLRYDPADKTHPSGHLHIGKGPALKIDEEDSVKIFVEAWFRNNK